MEPIYVCNYLAMCYFGKRLIEFFIEFYEMIQVDWYVLIMLRLYDYIYPGSNCLLKC